MNDKFVLIFAEKKTKLIGIANKNFCFFDKKSGYTMLKMKRKKEMESFKKVSCIE